MTAAVYTQRAVVATGAAAALVLYWWTP